MNIRYNPLLDNSVQFSEDWELKQPLDFQSFELASSQPSTKEWRFYRISEIPEANAVEQRLAMNNVLSAISHSNLSTSASVAYLLSGNHEGIHLYIGVLKSHHKIDLPEAGNKLQDALSGNFLGADITLLNKEKTTDKLEKELSNSRHIGLVTGVPTINEEETHSSGDNDFQGIERLANTLLGKNWNLLIVAQAENKEDIHDKIEELYELSTQLSPLMKTSVQLGRNTGSSNTETTGTSSSTTEGTSSSDTEGKSDSDTVNESQSDGTSHGQSSSTSTTKTEGTSSNRGHSDSETEGKNTGWSRGKSSSASRNRREGKESRSNTSNEGKTGGHSTSRTIGTNNSHGTTLSTATGGSETRNSNASTNKTKGNSQTSGTNTSRTSGTNNSQTEGSNRSLAESQSTGESQTMTRERINKRYEEIYKHINEVQLERFKQGLNKGLFSTSIYVMADNRSTYEILSSNVLSIFQGNKVAYTPLQVQELDIKHPKLSHFTNSPEFKGRNKHFEPAIISSTPEVSSHSLKGATWLTTQELSLLFGLPNKELPGIKLRENADFALNLPKISDKKQGIALGSILQNGRELPTGFSLEKEDLNKHLFITGVTGAGKTTTCLRLLLESDLPFLVIEPAKTEYRALYEYAPEVLDFYVLGREELSCFRLNPFQLLSDKESLLANVATLKATLTAVFPMEAAMPSILEEAIIKAYKEKGWDINSSENYLYDNPWANDSLAWPTFSHMILQLEVVIKSKGLGSELEEKYLGSLVARLSSMTQGIKGRMLDTPYSLDFDKLLDRKVVIELDELKASEDKAIFMGLIMGRVAQAMKQRHSKDACFKHLTLIEEAHRLLARPDPSGGGVQKQGVEMFANLLAEVRKYGEGLIIADQIPNNLIPEVIKNTNTKIIHRLLAADDRNTVGDAMGLNDEQKDFLPKLQAGEAIVYQGGWHGAVRIQIKEQAQTNLKPLDENKLAKAGQQLLYNNREDLFPYLSQCTKEFTPHEFSQLVEQGYKTINLLLKINHVLHRKDNKPKSWVEKLQQRFACQYQDEQGKGILADHLQAFAKDAVLLQVLNEDEFKEWVDYLPDIIHALSISVVAFEKFLEEETLRLLNQSFRAIAKAELDSI